MYKEYTEPAVHTLDYVENDENYTGKEGYKEFTEPAVHTLDYVENDENDTGKEVNKEFFFYPIFFLLIKESIGGF